ncbi:MAG: chromosomal replication initiator protein DnaA [bacterium]|nr:chromosomal replication initiator protein DnaA [bacterium]
MELVEEKWEKILLTLKEDFELTDVSFEAWIQPLKIESIENNTLYIPCEEQLAVNYITNKYLKALKVIITEQTGIDYKIELIGPEQRKNMKPKAAKTVTSAEVIDRSGLNPNYTFEKFVVGGNNRFAQSASLAVAESPGDTYNPLYIYGGPGLGKTHLMHAIGNFILEQNPEARILYVTSEIFTNEVIDSIRSGNANAMTKLREKYRTVDVLMIDDVQFIIGKESTQEEFFHTFNVLHSNGKQIILTSDKPPKDMETLEERIRSRFEWGLMADIGSPDYETRMAILRKKEEQEEINLSDEVLNYIATNIKSNIRELEGALNKLIAFSRLTNNEITTEVAAHELQNIINPNKPKEITLQLIVEIVCDHFQISFDQILSKNRSNEIAKPRMIAMYLAKNMTDASQEAIGSFLGGRDHSTVIHGIKKIEAEIQSNEVIKNQIEVIKKKINPN